MPYISSLLLIPLLNRLALYAENENSGRETLNNPQSPATRKLSSDSNHVAFRFYPPKRRLSNKTIPPPPTLRSNCQRATTNSLACRWSFAQHSSPVMQSWWPRQDPYSLASPCVSLSFSVLCAK